MDYSVNNCLLGGIQWLPTLLRVYLISKECSACCNDMHSFSRRDSKALKDENLPPVICQDVENFQ